jgi:Ca-activated chloride channel family protein
MVAELAGLAAGLVVLAAEGLHARRCRRLARLAFGPSERPRRWVRAVPVSRSLAAAGLAWGFVTLGMIPPKVLAAQGIPDQERRHLVLVLDVSPSMRLADSGPDGKQTRRARAHDLMKSFFNRMPIEQYLVSVVACYNGAKPVVEATKDMEVVRNILEDLPMEYAFDSGSTDLFTGIEEAARLARPWNPGSTLLVIITDGDTVPATGMPRLPDSVSGVLVVGVGNTRSGMFINGRMSRQDAATLRQVATRLRGAYHDGNAKQIPTDLIRRVAAIPVESPFEQLTLREYALMACGLGSLVLALLPLALERLGTSWRPGIRQGGTASVSARASRLPREVRIG